MIRRLMLAGLELALPGVAVADEHKRLVLPSEDRVTPRAT